MASAIEMRAPSDVLERTIADACRRLPDAVMITDAPARGTAPTILWVNEGFTRMTGYPPSEVVGKSPGLLDGPRTSGNPGLIWSEAARTGDDMVSESWHHRRDGTPFLMRWTVVPGRDASGVVRTLVALQRDVTSERQSGLELARRTRDLETVMSHSPDVIVRLDVAGRVVFVTDAAESVLGLRPTAIMHRPMLEFGADGPDLERLRTETESVQDRREPRTVVCPSPFGEGGRWLEIRMVPEPASAGGVGHVVWFARDVTARITAERALRESEERDRQHVEERLRQRELQLADLAESMPVFIWMTDETGCDVYANGSWMRFCGLSAIGPGTDEDWRERIHPEDRGIFKRAFAVGLGRRVAFEAEVRMIRADGDERTVMLGGIPRFDEDRFLGILGSATDLTERRRREESGRRAIADLEHASRLTMAGQMAAAMVHEMAQPLSAVATFVEIAMLEVEQGQAPDRVLATLRDAQESALRAGLLSRRMLGFVRRSDASSTRIDLATCIHKALGLMKADAASHRVSLEFDDSVAGVQVHGDPVELEQVFCNLLRNAIEAIESADRSGTITVTGAIDGDVARVAIKDDGPGVPPDLRREIFDAFRTRKRTGVGLGLWICWNILERHGGEIRLDETSASGTTFELTIPTADGAERRDADRAKPDVWVSGAASDALLQRPATGVGPMTIPPISGVGPEAGTTNPAPPEPAARYAPIHDPEKEVRS